MEESHVLATFSYTGILALALFFIDRDDYVTFHFRQGLIILAGLTLSIFVTPSLPRLGNIVFLVFLGSEIIGLSYAVQGQKRVLPVIGQMAQLLSWLK